jgi:hypothetical protein
LCWLVESLDKLVQGGRLNLPLFADSQGCESMPRAVDGHAVLYPFPDRLMAHFQPFGYGFCPEQSVIPAPFSTRQALILRSLDRFVSPPIL